MTKLRKSVLTIVLSALATNVMAQEKEAFTKPSFTGYAIANYQANFDQNEENSNGFGLRILRLIVKGKILEDFEYTVQGQANGNTASLGASPRIVDINVEWQKYRFFRVKMGQMKRPFTFENPAHPIDIGFSTLSTAVTNLSGFTDRTGEHASNGRDIGLQVQGDFLPNPNGHNLLHYQLGLFNGQGINTGDIDNKKDIIGGVWVMPLKGMRVGVFGWEGSYARRGVWTDADGKEHNGIRSLNQHRYAISAEYCDADWLVRSEFVHSTGYGFSRKGAINDNSVANNAEVNEAAGREAQGVYVQCIAPIIKGKLRAKARFDYYEPSGVGDNARTQYDVGLNYLFHKNLELQAQYSIVKDKSLADQDYSYFNTQLCFRF